MAILMVVWYHVGLPGGRGGFFGVDVFFVISGYLIIGLLHRELLSSARIRWLAFFRRRAARLLPAALVMLVLVQVLAVLVMNPLGDRQGLSKSAIAAAGSLANVYFWRYIEVDYFSSTGSGQFAFLHMWSLSVEEQFYVLVPFAFLLCAAFARRTGLRITAVLLGCLTALTALSFGLAIWCSTAHPMAGYFSPVTRAWEFGVGGLIAVGWKYRPKGLRARRALAIVASVLLIASILIAPRAAGYPNAWTLMPVTAAAAAISVGPGPGPWLLSNVLESRLLVQLGRFSYGWYLWHWPMLGLAASYNLAPVSLPWRLVAVAIALLLAVGSFYLIEARFRLPSSSTSAMGFRAWRGRVAAPLLTVLALSIMVSAIVGLQARAELRTGYWQQVYGWQTDFPSTPQGCKVASDGVLYDPMFACGLVEYRDGRPTLILWGDSHAWAYATAVARAASRHPINVVAWVAPSCAPQAPPEHGLGTTLAASDASAACDRHNRAALEYVQESIASGYGTALILAARWVPEFGGKPVSLVDLAKYEINSGEWAARGEQTKAGVRSLIETMVAQGVRVDLTAPLPELERHAPLCLESERFNCNVSRSRTDNYRRGALAFLEGLSREPGAGVHVIDPIERLCPSHSCPASRNGVVRYLDDNHLSASYARSLASEFAQSVRALVASQPSVTPAEANQVQDRRDRGRPRAAR